MQGLLDAVKESKAQNANRGTSGDLILIFIFRVDY